MNTLNHVFVYGTLKKDQHANKIISNGSNSICNARINGIMYDLGAYPGIKENSNSYVYGEIYAIKNQDMKSIDEYEGFYPENPEESLFIRKVTNASCMDGNKISVFAYFYNHDIINAKKISSGIWNK